jgi:hypothetical protein
LRANARVSGGIGLLGVIHAAHIGYSTLLL